MSKSKNNRGLALIAVLWLVAAMGLIITGVVKSVRGETSNSGFQRQSFKAQVQADACLVLALQNLHAQPQQNAQAVKIGGFEFAGQSCTVIASTLNGLIDINNAPASLFAELYRVMGGLNNEAAQTLAQTTIQARSLQSSKGIKVGFEASEDLMRVPGMTYDLYAMIRDLVTADIKDGSGRINPLAAPVAVLQVIAGGDYNKAAAYSANRAAGAVGLDGTFFKPDWVENTVSTTVRLQTTAELPGSGHVTRIWDVMGIHDDRTGLPWRILGKSSFFSKSASPNNLLNP